jgi:hypothetical protein
MDFEIHRLLPLRRQPLDARTDELVNGGRASQKIASERSQWNGGSGGGLIVRAKNGLEKS